MFVAHSSSNQVYLNLTEQIFRTRSENPLTVSQRSNNLQFSRSPHFQSLPSSQFGTRSVYLYTDPRSISAEGRPAKKPYQPNNNVRSITRGEGSSPEPYTRRAIASLITPYLPSKRTSKAAHHPHRLSSSSASSIHSVTSSIISRKRKYYYEHPTFASLPSEILGEIFSYLDQPTLLSLVKVSRRMVEEAANGLYCQPSFASTYRFAQFVTIVSKNSVLARMVRVLDLSKLGGCVEEDVPLAGWREWKYRDSPLHTIRRDDQLKKTTKTMHSPSLVRLKIVKPAVPNASMHPLPSPFLQQYSLSRDVPIGALIHLLTACQFLRKLNFSGVPLAADYSVLRTNTSSYTPVSFTGLLFVSDVPKSFTWKEGDTKPLHVTTDLVDAIIKLKYITQLKIKGGLWVTRDAATRLVEECKKLERVDFRECGMYKGNRWAVKGQRDEVRGVLHADREMLLRKRR